MKRIKYTGDPSTKTFSRTMQEAFGPHEDNIIFEQPEPLHKHDKIVLLACFLAFVVLVGLMSWQ